MARLKIGFVGTRAPHSFLFLDTLRLIPDTVESISLVEPDAARAAKAGAEKVYPTLDAMLAADKPDVCFIMLPTDEVEGPAIRCAEAGCPLVIDKHVTNTSESLRRILAACERHGVKMSTGYTWRYSPVAQDIRRWIAEGVLGRVFCFDIRMVTTSAEVRTRDPQFAWLFEKKRSGGGILIWLGCHYVDLVRFILQREVVAVSAVTARLTGARSDVEDVASVSLVLDDGSVGTLHCAYVMPAGLPDAYDTGLSVWGSEGDVTWEKIVGGANPTVRLRSVHGGSAGASPSLARCPERVIQYKDKLVPQAYGGTQLAVDYFRDMLHRLAAGEDHIVTGRDALKVLEICEAAYRSAETGHRVELNDE